MGLRVGRTELTRAFRELLRNWSETRTHWHDAKSQEFEDLYLSPLRGAVNSALEASEQLAKLTDMARRDCE